MYQLSRIIFIFVSICSGSTTLASSDRLNSSNNHELGRAIYNYRCYFCHGYSGDANTLTATFVTPAPRDFTSTAIESLSRQYMIETVIHGKINTAMHGFYRLLDKREIELVVDFIRYEFMEKKLTNTRYHTIENGWPDHQRYEIAFPFAQGLITLDTPWEQLSEQQSEGKRLFMTSCISCHDRAIVKDEGPVWEKQSISYPRNNYSHTVIDAISSASIYAKHDIPPTVANLSPKASMGKILWQDNCAFCHAADGSGENWIGSFLVPKPRDLRDKNFMAGMTREILTQRIKYGLKNTSMPAWNHVLNQEQIQQIISYISEAFHPVN